VLQDLLQPICPEAHQLAMRHRDQLQEDTHGELETGLEETNSKKLEQKKQKVRIVNNNNEK
jgi:hypothetical protein